MQTTTAPALPGPLHRCSWPQFLQHYVRTNRDLLAVLARLEKLPARSGAGIDARIRCEQLDELSRAMEAHLRRLPAWMLDEAHEALSEALPAGSQCW